MPTYGNWGSPPIHYSCPGYCFLRVPYRSDSRCRLIRMIRMDFMDFMCLVDVDPPNFCRIP